MKIAADIAGLNIGHSHATLVRLVEKDGKLMPQSVREVGLPPGTIDDEGMVVNAEAVTEAVKILCKQAKPKVKRVYVSLPATGLSIRPFSVPRELMDEELVTAVQWEVIPGLPYDRSEAVIDQHVIEPPSEDDQEKRVLSVACRKALPQALLKAVSAAGVEVVDIEPEPISLLRAVDVGRPADSNELLLSIGMHSSSVTVVRDGKARYVETLTVGSDHFTQALISVGMTGAEAEQFKRTSSMVGPLDDPYAEHRAAMAVVADNLAESLVSVLSFDDDGQNTAPTRRLVLCGGGAKLHGLDGHLNQQLNIEVAAAEPAPELEVADTAQFSRHAAAFALALHPASGGKD